MPSAIYVLKTAIDAESINDPRHRKTLSDRISDIKREQTLAIKEAKAQYQRAVELARRYPENKQRLPASW
jgi:hypothetical protein